MEKYKFLFFSAEMIDFLKVFVKYTPVNSLLTVNTWPSMIKCLLYIIVCFSLILIFNLTFNTLFFKNLDDK